MARAVEEGVDRDEQERDPERGRSDQGDTHDREAANPSRTTSAPRPASSTRTPPHPLPRDPAECHEREKTDGDEPAA